MKKFWVLFIVVVIVGYWSGCTTGGMSGYDEVGEGILIKYHEKSDSDRKVDSNSIVSLEMRYRLEDTILFSSEKMDEVLKFPINKPMYRGDLYDCLRYLSEGDSVTFKTVADSFFIKVAGYGELPGFVQAGDAMYYDIRLLKVQTPEEAEAERQQELQALAEEEQQAIQEFLESESVEYDSTASGLFVHYINKTRGNKPKEGDMLQVHFKISNIDGTPIYSNFDGTPADIEWNKKYDTPGFDEALFAMRAGEHVKILVPSKLGFGEQGRGQVVPPYTPLVYEIELLKIRSLEQVQTDREKRRKEREALAEANKRNENSKIQDYLKENNISADSTASGLYYIEKEAGAGAEANPGSRVTVHYVLQTLDGDVIEDSYLSQRPFSFTLGQGQAIPGWDEGIALMNQGGKATLIVPSKLAYRDRGAGEKIQPYMPLLFDVELIEVK